MKSQLTWMDTHIKRMIGAQFRNNLGGEILIFHYHQAVKRLFHTMWCPPIRVVVLSLDQADLEVVFDQVVQPWKFFRLPAGTLILEMDPDTEYQDVLSEILASREEFQRIDNSLLVGGVDSSVSITQLVFDLFSESMRDLRSVKNTCLNERGLLDPDKLVLRYSPWERGRILASAGFVLDFSCETGLVMPQGSIPLSVDLLKSEVSFADELLAASHAAFPDWKDILPAICLNCGQIASWRSVIAGDPNLPPEKSWRLLRPENNIPLCSVCAKRFKTKRRPHVHYELARSFWGARFEALYRWYLAEIQGGNGLPDNWDKHEYPLWPKSFGGDLWETGSGALKYVAPAWPRHADRATEHVTFLQNAGVYDQLFQLAE